MNRRSFVRSAALLGIAGAATPPIRAAAPEAIAILPQIRKAMPAALAMQRRDWEQGILAQAMLEAGERETVILLTRAAMVQREPDGRLAVVVSGSPTDPAMGGEAYARAAEWTGDPAMQQAVEGLLGMDFPPQVPARRGQHFVSRLQHAGNMVGRLQLRAAFPRRDRHHDEALAQIDGYPAACRPAGKLSRHIWTTARRVSAALAFWAAAIGSGPLLRLAHVLRHLHDIAAKIANAWHSSQRKFFRRMLLADGPTVSFITSSTSPALFVAKLNLLAQMLALPLMRAFAKAQLPGFNPRSCSLHARCRRGKDSTPSACVQGASDAQLDLPRQLHPSPGLQHPCDGNSSAKVPRKA